MNKQLIVSVFIAAVAIFSCQKYQNDLASAELVSSLTDAVSEISGMEVFEEGIEDVQSISVKPFDETTKAFTIDGYNPRYGFGNGFGHYGPIKFGIPHIDNCATVTVSSISYPKTIIVDYGTGCSDKIGHTKAGKIIIEISDTAINAGSIKTLKYEDFYLDSMKVALEASFKNKGKNVIGNWVIESNWEQTVTKPDGDVVVQKNEKSEEWLTGFGTTDKTDDVYYKSGSGSLVVNDTIKFSRNITNPLLVDKSMFNKSGTEDLNRNSNISIYY
jgi:hypothetical protein